MGFFFPFFIIPGEQPSGAYSLSYLARAASEGSTSQTAQFKLNLR